MAPSIKTALAVSFKFFTVFNLGRIFASMDNDGKAGEVSSTSRTSRANSFKHKNFIIPW